MIPIACDPTAIGAAARPRYNHLTGRVRAAIRDRAEIQEGYLFQLEGAAISLPEVAEWISLERLCCPFFTFQLSVIGGRPDWRLQLTGPGEVKVIIADAFPLP